MALQKTRHLDILLRNVEWEINRDANSNIKAVIGMTPGTEPNQKINSMMELFEAKSPEAYAMAISLFKEYAAQLDVDLSFQKFDQEILNIQYQYARPEGILFIAYDQDQQPMGCFGIRRFEDSICELKRMYLKQEQRGKGIGKSLLAKAIEAGRELHYKKMRLDTLPSMQAAMGLYRKMGFYEIPAYRYNPVEGTKFFEIQLER